MIESIKHRWPLLAAVLIVVISTVTSVISGVISNVAADYVRPFLGTIWSTITASISGPTAIPWLLALFFALLAVYKWRQAHEAQVKGEELQDEIAIVQTNATKLGERLMALVGLNYLVITRTGEIISSTEQQTTMDQIIREYLERCARLLGQEVTRAIYLAPDQDVLRGVVGYQMPRETLMRCEFYLGDDPKRRRGCAGEAFVSNEVRIVKFDIANGKPVPSDSSYIPFDESRTNLPYREFVAIPVTSDEGDRHGVVCFDSPVPDAFDDPNLRPLLSRIGATLAALLTVAQQLRQRREAA